MQIRPMSEKDIGKRLEKILDLAMMANPWATRVKYRGFFLPLFREFPYLAFVAVDGRKIVGWAELSRGKQATSSF